MTILSLLKERLIGNTIKVFQSKKNPDYFITEQYKEEYCEKDVVVKDIVYVEPYGEYEIESGDYFKVIFNEGSVILDNN